MQESRTKKRQKRHLRIKKNIFGTIDKPRLCVFKSNKNFYAQLINDVDQTTITASSTKYLKTNGKNNIAAATLVGEDIAKKIIASKINEVVFDRSGYLYHGKVKAFADAARKNGLKF